MNGTNPLTLRTSTIPFSAFSAKQIGPAIEILLADTTGELEALRAPRDKRTFENTMVALDNLGLTLEFAMGIISHLESVATTPAWREAYNSVLPKVTEFRSRLSLDEGLWNALKEYAQTPEASTLPAHKARFLTKTLESFRRSGADLPTEKKEVLARINTELAQLTNSFSQNTLDATNAFEYVTTSIDDLRGLPESALMMGRTLAAAKGVEGWRFTLQGPSFLGIMTYADSAHLREMFYTAYNTRCSGGSFDNVNNLYRILELRRERANLLGYKDFSDLVLADRMAKNGATAESFVTELRGKIESHFERDNKQLAEFVRTDCGIDPASLKPWDMAYYAEKMRRAHYDFDEEELRPYFPLPRVMSGLFSLVERLFEISVRENTSLSSWDDSVTGYSAFDTRSGKLLGHFYADLHPRENKRGGAWMNSLITHVPTDGETLPHVGLIAGNFTPPSENTPSLLTHDEVTTLFHEFGHLLHHLCGATDLRGQSMSDVAWDFIELPSQIMENWCWDRDSLDAISGHYQTGEAIPEDLFVKMTRARNFRSASLLMRQLGFSTVDLALHRNFDRARDGDIVAYSRRTLSNFTALPLPENYAMILGFTHLFSSPVGYAAGYYSYQWAEVLDADAFSRFKNEGLLNRSTGLDFRDKILSRGDSQDPAVLFESFMGRGPDMSALLERAGLSGVAS